CGCSISSASTCPARRAGTATWASIVQFRASVRNRALRVVDGLRGLLGLAGDTARILPGRIRRRRQLLEARLERRLRLLGGLGAGRRIPHRGARALRRVQLLARLRLLRTAFRFPPPGLVLLVAGLAPGRLALRLIERDDA